MKAAGSHEIFPITTAPVSLSQTSTPGPKPVLTCRNPHPHVVILAHGSMGNANRSRGVPSERLEKYSCCERELRFIIEVRESSASGNEIQLLLCCFLELRMQGHSEEEVRKGGRAL